MASRIKSTLTAEDIQKFKDAIAVIQAITPFRAGMTTQERKRACKMGKRSRALMDMAAELVATRPDLLPRSIDPQTFLADVAAFKVLEELLMALSGLTDELADTKLAMGVAVYADSRMIYKSARLTGQAVEAKAAVSDMRGVFHKTPRKDKATKGSTPAG